MQSGLPNGTPGHEDISILIVSFNTKDVLRECLRSVVASSVGLSVETIVVDNCSRDGSMAMVREEFPWAQVIESEQNLGFGGANNLGFEAATGKYVVLLNSDAFLGADTLRVSLDKMEADPHVGLAGGRLVGRNGKLQRSARMFPSLLRQALILSGLSDHYPRSRFFGQSDRTWADPMQPAEVDWVPGAFSIIRADLLDKIGFFDPRFFLYYEEVDLCMRIKQAGYKVMYWPDIEVIHIGGESSRQVKTLEMSKTGAQLVLWRMRSTLLYFRKHKGWQAGVARWMEELWSRVRAWRNGLRGDERAQAAARNHGRMADLMKQAWQETNGGRVSPPQPW
ncbi:MAG TPA: glycosyltransferase family 2 protein [Acidisarcina sp.]